MGQKPGRRIIRQPTDAPMLGASVQPVLQVTVELIHFSISSGSFFVFALYGLFTSSLGSRNVHLTKTLIPLIVLSLDHQNHSKWHKRCHVRYNLPILVIDNNTIKESIKLARIDKFNHLIPIETTYTCLDAYHHCAMFVTISPIIQ